MLSKKQVLKLENRRAIFNFIDKHPGLHKREIIRKFKLSEGTVRYHINHLIKNGFISEEIESGYTRYFVTDKVGRLEKEMLGILRRKIPRKIIIFGLIYFVFSKAELSRELEKDTKTIYYHLKRLKKMDIIESVIAKDGIIHSNRNGCIYEHPSAP